MMCHMAQSINTTLEAGGVAEISQHKSEKREK